jgi:hypothetical protein
VSEVNKAIVRRLYEAVENQGKLELLDELVDPHFRDASNRVAPFPASIMASATPCCFCATQKYLTIERTSG